MGVAELADLLGCLPNVFQLRVAEVVFAGRLQQVRHDVATRVVALR
jgi:hypothetical protein